MGNDEMDDDDMSMRWTIIDDDAIDDDIRWMTMPWTTMDGNSMDAVDDNGRSCDDDDMMDDDMIERLQQGKRATMSDGGADGSGDD